MEIAMMNSKTKLTRRSLMSALGTAAAAAPLVREAGAQTTAGSNSVILAVTGDESHNSDHYRTALTATLVKDAGIPIDFTDEEKLITYENLQRYKILILFRNGTRHPGGYNNIPGIKVVSEPPLERKIDSTFVATITDEQCKGIKRWVQEGGSLWAWHNNSRLSLMRQDYRDVQGATILGHPPIRPFKVKIINHDHPITKGVSDFVVTDEQHFLIYEKDPKDVLAMSVQEEGLTYPAGKDRKPSNTCEAAWAYEYGKGRVCFFAPGHAITALWNPEFEKMQKNAVKWLLHQTSTRTKGGGADKLSPKDENHDDTARSIRTSGCLRRYPGTGGRSASRQQEREVGIGVEPLEFLQGFEVHRHPRRDARHRVHRPPVDAVPQNSGDLQHHHGTNGSGSFQAWTPRGDD